MTQWDPKLNYCFWITFSRKIHIDNGPLVGRNHLSVRRVGKWKRAAFSDDSPMLFSYHRVVRWGFPVTLIDSAVLTHRGRRTVRNPRSRS